MKFSGEIQIDDFLIRDGAKAFVIAEIGVNHNGDLSLAMELIRQAALSGADCVKFQTFKAERVVTANAPKARYQREVTDQSESQLDMLRKLELRPEYYQDLIECAEEHGLGFLSTPYNFEDIDLLEKVGVRAYKVASGQIVELAFLRKAARTGKPLILSTGMATVEEIHAALKTIYEAGNDQLVLLQCTTNYPSALEDAHLRVIPVLREQFGCLIGYSDHTPGEEAALAAVALGACVLEKHFTLDRSLPGPDHASSVTPHDLNVLVNKIRRVESALGQAVKQPTPAEQENARGMRRSIVAARPIGKGKIIDAKDITFKRPADGLSPRLYDDIIGKKAIQDIPLDELLKTDMIE